MSEKRRRVSKVSDEELLAAAADAPNMRQLLRTLGIAAYGGNYESIRGRLTRLGAMSPSLAVRLRHDCDATSEELAAAAANSETVRGLFRFLDLPYNGFAHARMVRRLREEGVDTAHFLGQRANTGRTFPGRAKPLAQILVVGDSYSTHALRRRLIHEGVLEPECSCCRLRTWNDRPIPLELDHINGDRSDNRLENLRLLCPNCHAQTDTYRGRNIGRPSGAAALHRPAAKPEFDAVARLTAVLGLAG